jgi:site-specific DNA recombinase
LKAVGYLRVSTEEQVIEGYSIDAQKNRIIEYCKTNDYDLIDYYVDEGVSGKSLKRPKVQELIADVKNNKFDVIVVYRLDRFSRSLRDIVNLAELLEKYNVQLKSTSEEIDISSLSGKAMLQMLGVFAEFERGSIAERVALALEQRAREGYYKAPKAPFGYTYDPKTQNYLINPEQAAIVREIFALHQSGKGVDAICKIMNDRGIRTTEGCKFHRTFIIRMFQKGWYYCGKFMFRLRTNKKPILLTAANIPETILTEEEFLKSHKIYGANARDNRKKHDDKAYIFKGKLRCAYCGTMLISNTAGRRRDKNAHDKVYRYYRCYHKREGQCNEARYWTESGVDKVFLDFLKRFSSSKVEIDLETAKADEKKILNKKRLLEEQVFKEQNRKKKLQYLLLDEDISKDDFLRMSVEISETIENLEREMAKLDADLAEIAKAENLEQQKAIAKSIAEEWGNLDPVRKKEFLNAFVKTIFIGRDGIKKIDFIL